MPINLRVENLRASIVQAQQLISQKVRCHPDKRKSWWCSLTLDPVVQIRNRARRWFLLTKFKEARECYREWNTYFLSLVLALKNREWQQFLESPTHQLSHKLWKISKRRAGSDILPLQQQDGSLTHLKQEQAELLFKGTSAPPAPFDCLDIPPRELSCFFTYPQISTAEIALALNKTWTKKACGVDGISNEMLKLVSPVLSPILNPILNEVVWSSVFPDPWKRAVTVIIQKAGKKDYTLPGAYRPIALLNSLVKVFELIIARRLTHWTETSCILAEGHLGRRKGSGTDDALLVLDRWIRCKWWRKKLWWLSSWM